MYENSVQYFPSLREIRDQLIEAQMHYLSTKSKNWHDKSNFRALKNIYMKNWKMLFDMADLGNLDEPLTAKILSNPEHTITRHLL